MGRFANFYANKLSTDIGASDTTIRVDALPRDTSGSVITAGRLVLEARNKDKREIIRYTGVSGTDLTGVLRGRGGTIAKVHLKGAIVEMNPTAEDFEEALGLSFAFPTGIVMPYAGASAPTGWLVADGSAVSRTTYAALFAVIGTSFGAGNGTTTFNLPNMKGRVPVGLDTTDTDFNTIGKTGGQKTVQSHTHNNKNLVGTNSNSFGTWVSAPTAGGGTFGFGYGTHVSDSAGSGTNNMNPYISLNYIIKT